jgi:hypothetical protein
MTQKYGNMCNNSWIHCAVVYGNNQTIKLYFNGDLLATGTSTGTLTGMQNFMLGQKFNLWHLRGYASDCRVYNRELSSQEVLALYETTGGIDYELHKNIHVRRPKLLY